MGTSPRLWSAARIAAEFGWKNAATARKWLARHGIEHKDTEGPRDTRLYDPEEVRTAKAGAPGPGARTDLRKRAEEADTKERA